MTTRTMCICLGLAGVFIASCDSKPPEGRIALQATWEGIEGDDALGTMLEFSGTHFYYTAAETDYHASGTFVVYLGESPKVMVQTLTETSSDPSITEANPLVSYILYEISGDELKMGFASPQATLDSMPGTFDAAYYMERYRKIALESTRDGEP